MAQIRQVVSEALQKQIRDILPSQQGFTEDLQATNVIQPIIDLTPSTEGSTLGVNLQTALAFGSQTAFSVKNTTTTIINNTGFYRVFGTVSGVTISAAEHTGQFNISDGLSTKRLLTFEYDNGGTVGVNYGQMYDFVVYLTSGDSLSVTSTIDRILVSGSTRQIADVNGNLVNPSGFTSS